MITSVRCAWNVALNWYAVSWLCNNSCNKNVPINTCGSVYLYQFDTQTNTTISKQNIYKYLKKITFIYKWLHQTITELIDTTQSIIVMWYNNLANHSDVWDKNLHRELWIHTRTMDKIQTPRFCICTLLKYINF